MSKQVKRGTRDAYGPLGSYISVNSPWIPTGKRDSVLRSRRRSMSVLSPTHSLRSGGEIPRFRIAGALPGNRKFASLRQQSAPEKPHGTVSGHRENPTLPGQTYTFTCTLSQLLKITCFICFSLRAKATHFEFLVAAQRVRNAGQTSSNRGNPLNFQRPCRLSKVMPPLLL